MGSGLRIYVVVHLRPFPTFGGQADESAEPPPRSSIAVRASRPAPSERGFVIMGLPIVGPSRRRRDDSRGRGRPRRGLAGRPPLEALEARSLLSQVFVVTNTDDDTNPGSLRWAIGQVDTDGTDDPADPDQIHFDIPQADPGFGLTTPGVWTIAPATALPIIDAPCVVDGYTQPGAAPGTSAGAIDAVLKIELDGSAAPHPSTGLIFGQASGSSISGLTSGVRGLAIHSFDTDVFLQGQGTFVQGCFLGTDAAGAGTEPSGANTGIVAFGIANVIGGATPADRNLISNLKSGIVSGANELLVAGNLIGTDLAGASQLPNSVGITLGSGNGDTVGGATPAARNVISGNVEYGIEFQSLSITDSVVEGNYIGTDVTGTKPIQNRNDGIYFASGTSNTIGGTSPSAANVISSNGLDFEGTGAGIDFAGPIGANANVVEGNLIGTDATGTKPLGNAGNGIRVDAGVANSFLDNVIAFNGAIGIDLVGGVQNSFGVTANSPGGPHDGPNNLQNYPVLTSAVVTSGQTVIEGTLNSNPSSSFRVDFYAVPKADPSGHGQALTFLGSTTVDTDASGNTPTPFRFTAMPNLSGQQITATATFVIESEGSPLPLLGSTSEFSADIPVTAAPPSLIGTTTFLRSLLNPSVVGQTATFEAIVSSDIPVFSPTGTVTFSVDGAAVATLPFTEVPSEGPSFVFFTTSSLSAGSHTVTAHCNPGGSNFAPSDSQAVQQVVDKAGTTTTLTPSSPTPRPPASRCSSRRSSRRSRRRTARRGRWSSSSMGPRRRRLRSSPRPTA